jgi:hypothetical protein
MKVEKLKLSGSCDFTLTTFEGIEHKSVCLEYTEHATDHWNSDSETSIDLDAEKAREIIALLHKAFPALAAAATVQEPPNLETKRERFERWALSRNWIKDVQKYPDDYSEKAWAGKYGHANTQIAWEAWQAATNTTPPAAPVQELEWKQIAEDLRFHGLTLVKTATGYAVLKLGAVQAQATPPTAQPAPVQEPVNKEQA